MSTPTEPDATPAPEVRALLFLSTRHLPPDLAAGLLGRQADVVAAPVEGGWHLWVPDQETIAGTRPPRDEIAVIWRFARAHRCDYVTFDADAPTHPDLPTWDW